MKKIKIIAEIASAHQGDGGRLKRMVEESATKGADAVKFQWFKYDYLATPDYEYYPIYEQLFLQEKEWLNIADYAKGLGLEVWVDIVDEWGLNLVKKHSKKVDGVKVPSTLLESNVTDALAKTSFPLIIGVGGRYISEIRRVLKRVEAYNQKREIVLMDGFQGYPTQLEDTNLKRIKTLSKTFKYPIGFADHIDGTHPLATEIPVYALFAGAQVIEKHITINRNAKGYDYYSSLEPPEFAVMTEKIRKAELIMNNGKVNAKQRSYLKDSVRTVLNSSIKKGEIINTRKLAFKRTSHKNALLFSELENIIPGIAKRDMEVDDPLLSNCIKTPRIVIAVVCRLKSKRLPKKALLPIHGVPSIERCLLNCLDVPEVNEVVLATSTHKQDEQLAGYTLDGRVKVLRGDPDNVVKRMLQVSELAPSDIILRVTGDSPVISKEVISYLIKSHLANGSDFTIAENAAIGTTGDVITIEALNRLNNYSGSMNYTEYMSYYFLNNPQYFSINKVKIPEEFLIPGARLTLDEPNDLKMLESIFSGLNIGREPVSINKIKDFLNQHPEVKKINTDVPVKWKDNQNFIKKLNEDTILNLEHPNEKEVEENEGSNSKKESNDKDQ